MEREANVKSKTVRFDKELIEKILGLIETKFEGWSKPDFSDLARYGLRIVLASFGIEYEQPSTRDRDVDYHSARRAKDIKELEDLIAELYIESYQKRDEEKNEESTNQ